MLQNCDEMFYMIWYKLKIVNSVKNDLLSWAATRDRERNMIKI
jgi:hypothetical protein